MGLTIRLIRSRIFLLGHWSSAGKYNHEFKSQMLSHIDYPRRYLFDEDIRDDPVAFQKLYDEVKIEAAMVIVVCCVVLLLYYKSLKDIQNSPYAEVRAVVDNHDDPNMPALTFRAGVIGLIYVVIGAFLNQFFSIRQPGITITSNVAQLL